MEIIFAFIIGILIFADFKLYKTFFTPFSLLATIYLALILLNNYVAINLGFFKVENQSIIYVMYFLILIYFISVIFYFLFTKNKFTPEYNAQKYIKNVVLHNKCLILFVFLVGLLAKYLSLYQVISIYGIANIKGKAFGLLAHIGNLGLVLTPYIFILFLHSKKLRYLILIAMMYMNLFIFGGKYGIIISILHLIVLLSLIYDINIKKTIRTGFLIVLIGISVFIIIYALIPSISQENFNVTVFTNRILFSLKHFLFYIVSPVIATNHFFMNSGFGSIEKIFTVPINIVKALFRLGNYVNPINPILVPVHSYYNTNVGGLFAETVYESNFVVASVYISLFFIFVYLVFNIARYRGRMLSLSALLLAVVMMMFFVNFLTVSGVVLQIIFLLIVELMIMKKIVFNKKN